MSSTGSKLDMEVLSAVTAASSWGALGPRRERNEDDILRPKDNKMMQERRKKRKNELKKRKRKGTRKRS